MQEVELVNTKIASEYRKGLVPLLIESQLQLSVIVPSIMINSWRYLSSSWALSNLRKYEEANTIYDQILELDPKSEQAWYNKGISLYHLGKYDDAIQYFSNNIRILKED